MTWIIDVFETLADLPFGLVLTMAGLLACVEAGLGIGMLILGETGVVILAATATTVPRFGAMLIVVGLGASAGDHVGYWLGRRHGPRLRDAAIVRKIGTRHWDRATAALHKHGASAVFLTRILPVVRTLTPAAAGASGVRYARFLPASLAGALTWSAVYVSIGAFAGASARNIESRIGTVGFVVLGVSALVILTVVVSRRRHRRHRRPRALAAVAGQAFDAAGASNVESDKTATDKREPRRDDTRTPPMDDPV